MKVKKDVSVRTIEKKNIKKKGVLIRSQLKAGGFWEDMRALYGMKPS